VRWLHLSAVIQLQTDLLPFMAYRMFVLCFLNSYERQVIESYLWDGFQYNTICRFLSQYHNIRMSRRTLHRRLRDYGVCRRIQPSSLHDVWTAIQLELQGSGKLPRPASHFLIFCFSRFAQHLLWLMFSYFMLRHEVLVIST